MGARRSKRVARGRRRHSTYVSISNWVSKVEGRGGEGRGGDGRGGEGRGGRRGGEERDLRKELERCGYGVGEEERGCSWGILHLRSVIVAKPEASVLTRFSLASSNFLATHGIRRGRHELGRRDLTIAVHVNWVHLLLLLLRLWRRRLEIELLLDVGSQLYLKIRLSRLTCVRVHARHVVHHERRSLGHLSRDRVLINIAHLRKAIMYSSVLISAHQRDEPRRVVRRQSCTPHQCSQ